MIIDYKTPYMTNSVIGNYRGKIIIKQDDGQLFFCEMPNNLIMLGETLAPRDLTSISELPNVERSEIERLFSDTEV